MAEIFAPVFDRQGDSDEEKHRLGAQSRQEEQPLDLLASLDRRPHPLGLLSGGPGVQVLRAIKADVHCVDVGH